MNVAETLNEPWNSPWPPDGLEEVKHCPVCGDPNRQTLHFDLIDNTFRVAPGKWALWQCMRCRSAYLDPRPTQDTIHLAYANYYTHQQASGKGDYADLNLLGKLRRRLVNGYTNWRYSTKADHASPIGIPTLITLWPYKAALDREYRNLPRLPEGGGMLLDVGCGGGSFLSLARNCGWQVVGLDPDPKAVTNAQKLGLIVHQGDIEYFKGKAEMFDVITLNHVIEHVHDPSKVLEVCHTLLKPGGQLWLETPNINSEGFKFFNKNWRGLEAPRHLMLFNFDSLHESLISAGYINIRQRARPSGAAWLAKTSFAIANEMSRDGKNKLTLSLRWRIVRMMLAELVNPQRKELLTLSCQKSP